MHITPDPEGTLDNITQNNMGSLYNITSRRLAIWPTLSPHVHLRKATDWRPFPLDQPNCRIYSRARQAIWSACHALQLEKEDVFLVPAYHHGSEIEALLQAGVKIKYYEVNEAMEPDAAALELLLDRQTKALYLIHYLGFPQDAAFWRRWCDARGLLLVEDAAQAFLATRDGEPVGSFGHLAVFCLYKTYGIPDGGAIVSMQPPPFPGMGAESGYWRMLKRHLNWVAARRGEFGLLHKFIKPLFAWWKRVNDKEHAEFDLGNPDTPPSLMTTRLLPKILDQKTAQRRRDNYLYLLEHLKDMVPRQFSTIVDGACPFAFPLEVPDAQEFLARLKQKGILGLLFWINPHPSLPVEQFPRSRTLRERILALPVHQELTIDDLNKIVSAVRACCRPQSAVTIASAA